MQAKPGVFPGLCGRNATTYLAETASWQKREAVRLRMIAPAREGLANTLAALGWDSLGAYR
jgi:hypothetical protein